MTWLNNAKLRASWGQLGNQNIGLYPYQAMIESVSNYPFDKKTETVGYQQKLMQTVILNGKQRLLLMWVLIYRYSMV